MFIVITHESGFEYWILVPIFYGASMNFTKSILMKLNGLS